MVELRHLPADALGLPAWARRTLAERPRPATTPGLPVPATLDNLPRPPDKPPEDLEVLGANLEGALAAFEPHVAVLESCRRLRDPKATLVLAGQQPGLAGGPVYNLFKAVHAIRLARALEERWGTPVLPAFWNHADDHDVAEVHHVWIQNPNLDLRKAGLRSLSSGRQPVGDIRLETERHGLDAFEELLRQNLWEGPEREAALQTFLPRDGETFAQAFTRTLLDLFGHHGLIVIEPEWIRGAMSQSLSRIVTAGLGESLRAGAELVRATDREVRIDPDGAALLYRHVDGRRQALRLKGDELAYDDEAGSRTAVELAAELVQDPLEWSPGALLRPLVQDTVLPVAAYVGGWGELDYHAQLGPLRRAANVALTPFVPRLSGTLVDSHVRSSLRKLDLTLPSALAAKGQLGRAESDEGGAPAVITTLRKIGERAGQELLELRDEMSALDKGLAMQLKRGAGQMKDVVEKIAAKAERVHSNASGRGRRHYRRLDNGLWPREIPQERGRSAIEFVARCGREWLDELIEEIEPLPTEHVVVDLHDREFPSASRPGNVNPG